MIFFKIASHVWELPTGEILELVIGQTRIQRGDGSGIAEDRI